MCYFCRSASQLTLWPTLLLENSMKCSTVSVMFSCSVLGLLSRFKVEVHEYMLSFFIMLKQIWVGIEVSWCIQKTKTHYTHLKNCTTKFGVSKMVVQQGCIKFIKSFSKDVLCSVSLSLSLSLIFYIYNKCAVLLNWKKVSQLLQKY